MAEAEAKDWNILEQQQLSKLPSKHKAASDAAETAREVTAEGEKHEQPLGAAELDANLNSKLILNEAKKEVGLQQEIQQEVPIQAYLAADYIKRSVDLGLVSLQHAYGIADELMNNAFSLSVGFCRRNGAAHPGTRCVRQLRQKYGKGPGNPTYCPAHHRDGGFLREGVRQPATAMCRCVGCCSSPPPLSHELLPLP